MEAKRHDQIIDRKERPQFAAELPKVETLSGWVDRFAACVYLQWCGVRCHATAHTILVLYMCFLEFN